MESVERAFGLNLKDFVEASPGGKWIPAAGGVAAYLGASSPLTTVKGAGPELRDSDVAEIEEFFRHCGSDQALFELAPWVSTEALRRRGYEIVGAEDVVVRRPPLDEPEPAMDVATVTPADWPELQLRSNGAENMSPWREIVALCAALPNATRFGVRENGDWIACAEVMPAGEVAIFGNDATCPANRGRGAQLATIRARLRAVAPLGFQSVAAEVAPGSGSERNYLRCGFEIAYRRTWYSRAIPR